MNYRRIAGVAGAVVVIGLVLMLSACAQRIERAEDTVARAVALIEVEKQALNDGEYRRWRKLRALVDKLVCNLSQGAIERNASAEERAIIAEVIERTGCK